MYGSAVWIVVTISYRCFTAAAVVVVDYNGFLARIFYTARSVGFLLVILLPSIVPRLPGVLTKPTLTESGEPQVQTVINHLGEGTTVYTVCIVSSSHSLTLCHYLSSLVEQPLYSRMRAQSLTQSPYTMKCEQNVRLGYIHSYLE